MVSFDDYKFSYGGHSITLRPFVLTPTVQNPDILGAYIRVDVIENEEFPAEVFIWERYAHMQDNGDIVSRDRPVCVAKPSDLDTFPVNNPNSERRDLPPFFRTSWFEMTIGSPTILIETWEGIKIDVRMLLKTVVDLGGP